MEMVMVLVRIVLLVHGKILLMEPLLVQELIQIAVTKQMIVPDWPMLPPQQLVLVMLVIQARLLLLVMRIVTHVPLVPRVNIIPHNVQLLPIGYVVIVQVTQVLVLLMALQQPLTRLLVAHVQLVLEANT
jgi:hypothetical protein